MTDTKPVAWMHTMHMEGDQTRAMLTFYDYADCYEPDRTVFGKPGRDYSEEYAVSSVPLYAAPQPCTDCAALRDEVERLRLKLEFAIRTLREEGYSDEGPTVTSLRAALNGGKHD